MALIKCTECGADISDKASMCPKCGCPIEMLADNKNNRKLNIKKVILVIIGLLMLLIVGCLVYKLLTRPDTSGYYNGVKWGIGYEEALIKLGDNGKANEKKDIILVDIDDYEGRQGVRASILYKFTEGALTSVEILIFNNDTSSYTDVRLIEEYVKQFESLYGEYEKETISYVWNTENSIIKLSNLLKGMVMLTYESIGTLEQ